MALRGKGARKEASREDIIEAARALLLERGHDKLSLREVARRASFSPAGLYEYFDGKDDLVRAVAERIERQIRLALAEASAGETRPRRRIHAILMAYIAFARDHPEDFQLVYAQLAQPRRSLLEPTPPHSPWSVLVDAVQQAIDVGALQVPEGAPLDAVAYGLWALAHGAAMLQLTYLKDFDAPFEVLDSLHIGALIRALGEQPPQSTSASSGSGSSAESSSAGARGAGTRSRG